MPPLPRFRITASSTHFAESLVRSGARILPDEFQTAINIIRDFHVKFGRYPNVLAPRSFSEKALARKIFDRRPQLTRWADKYAVKDYVAAKIGTAALPRLYHVTANPSDIPFDKLPAKYVVKATHGSGWVYLVRDATSVNRREVISECNKWLRASYYDFSKEWAYKNIPPRIIVEEFLDSGNGGPPSDYKFFVFGGKAQFVQVDVNRFTDHRRNFYDAHWNRLDCQLAYMNFDGDIAKPSMLETMFEYAETLSDDIDFVRVDLYEVGNKIYFGELTNVPGSGLEEFVPASWDDRFGQYWKMQTNS